MSGRGETLTVLETLESKEQLHWSQKIAVKYQLRIVFRYHDFLNVIVKECEKEIQSYLRRVLVQKQSYENFAGKRVKTLFKRLFFTCFIYVVVF